MRLNLHINAKTMIKGISNYKTHLKSLKSLDINDL